MDLFRARIHTKSKISSLSVNINGNFEIVKTTVGKTSIRNKVNGEILHNPVGPWAESQDLYISQCELESRLLDSGAKSLVVFDIGLGGGFNSLAAWRTKQKLHDQTTLHIYSFENDLGIFKFSMDHAEELEITGDEKSRMQSLFDNRKTTFENGDTWTLVHGDFLTKITEVQTKADVIFFDFYSPAFDSKLWGPANLKNLFDVSDEDAVLATYSTATAIKTSFLLAGFFVGVGKSSGFKLETTFVSRNLDNLTEPLGERWMERWQRSHACLPYSDPPLVKDEVFQMLLKHPQFAGLEKFRK